MITGAAASKTAAMDSFAGVVRRYQSLVFGLAFNFLHDRALAEELAQEVFLELHRAMPGLESDAHIANWLRRVTTHRCIDCARRIKSRPQVALEDVPEPASTPKRSDPLLARKIRSLTATLPEKARAVLLLRYQEDLEPSEIATALGMPVNTVKSHLHRALTTLREKLERTGVTS
ncbi:MAG TPA: sigma-70 family RNA polymerase sigma factor [Bryobacteraceae bacterium]|nr:sigma-70 family RNA polymerase sigma factor [Bryobacteraceae bacterium]